MRLFAAIVPPGDALDELAAAVDRARPPSQDFVRWTDRGMWHLTLAFYGDDDLDRRASWLAERVPGHAPLRLAVSGAGAFTGVLWAGIAGDLGELGSLAGAVGGAEDRPYHAHLTLARWKQRRRPQVTREVQQALAGFRGQAWPAAEVVLMSSVLSHRGPTYTAEHCFTLTG